MNNAGYRTEIRDNVMEPKPVKSKGFNLGKALKSIVRVVKENPQPVIIGLTLFAPGLAKRFAPIIVAATNKPVE